MHADRFGAKNMQTLGRRLRVLREARQWSLKRLGAASGVSVTAIRNIELGQSNPSLVTIMLLVDCLGVSIDQLIAEARSSEIQIKVTRGTRSQGATAQNITGDLAASEILGTIRSMSEDATRPVDLGSRAVFGYVLEGAVQIADKTGVMQCSSGDAFHLASGEDCHLTTAVGAETGDVSPRVLLVNGAVNADPKSSNSGMHND